MAATLFSITLQRSVSLLTGQTRREPIHPLRAQAGEVHIGSQRVRAVVWSADELAARDAARTSDWNSAKQARRAHECAAAAMGEMCGHAVDA